MSAYARQRLRAVGSVSVILRVDNAQEAEELASYFQPGDLVESLSDPGGGATAVGAARKHIETAASPLRYFPNLGIGYGIVDRQGWADLKKTRKSKKAPRGTPMLRPIRAFAGKSDANAPNLSWGLKHLNVPALWKMGLSGAGVRVAHLDTGVKADHPALDGAIAAFAEFDPLGQKIDHRLGFDSGNHGTHTAGIIAGREVKGRAIGVAPGCSLVSGVVLDGGDLVARVLAGVDWAIAQNVRILNLSLGYPEYWEDYIPVLESIRSKGILPVFAVGNEGQGTSRSPGNYPMALSVGAIDSAGRVLEQSSSQTFDRSFDPIVPDLVVPGADIISADSDGGFRAESGTSMAAPHISGMAALLWEAKPEATVDEIEACIFASCTLTAEQPMQRANRGVPNALTAYKHLVSATAAKTKRRKRIQPRLR